MAYQPHIRIVANGGMPGGERWSCSLAFSWGVQEDPPPTQAQLDACAAAGLTRWTTAVQSAGLLLSSGVSLQRVDARSINTLGATTLLSQAAPSSAVVGAGLPVVPNQVAVVVSLRTAAAGARGRGRFYLPTLQANVDTAGRLASSQRTTIANVTSTMLNGLNSDLASALDRDSVRLSVASGVGTGTLPPVTSMRVGDVFDTQRRRRDKIVENYESRPIT